MIGVCLVLLCWRMSSAVSMPSMSGMLTSSRITANSRSSSSRSASAPEAAITRFWPSSSSTTWKARRLSGRSSTTRMLTFSSIGFFLPVQPPPQHGEQVDRIHRFREVVPGARADALLAVALHRLGGHRDDRQVLLLRQLADLLHRGDAVHLRHHDI